MGKIIISESQYRKVKTVLIERAISEQTTMSSGQNTVQNTGQNSDVDYKSLGIDTKNGTLTLQNTFEAENAQGSTRDELKLFKGAVFKIGQNFASKGILVSNTNIQMVGSLGGGAGSAPRKSTVHYYCKAGKFNIPGLPDTYFNEDFVNVKTAFREMCKLAKTPQVSSQGNVGQTTYNSKNLNQLVGKKDNTKKMTIPANTAFSFNEGKNGVGFKVNYQNGWFDCKTSTFIINKVEYTSKNLGETLSKNLCKTTPSVDGGGGSGSGSGLSSGTSQSQTYDFENYI